MTCKNCIPWCPTTEKQWENRLANMGDGPDAKPYECPQCGGTDWAISRERIVIDGRPWWQRAIAKLFGDDRSHLK